jgi:catechol 2,3-dioxygenase-like lactoylglutathione lyase family enzyme
MFASDPEAAAKFYCDEAFDMEVVGHTDSPLAGAKK